MYERHTPAIPAATPAQDREATQALYDAVAANYVELCGVRKRYANLAANARQLGQHELASALSVLFEQADIACAEHELRVV